MLVSLFVATLLKSQLISEYYIVQRINYIAPRLSILSDNYYERSVRQIILENTGSWLSCYDILINYYECTSTSVTNISTFASQ